MKRLNKLHLSYNDKLDLLKQVLSPVGALDLADEIDCFTFQQLRALRDIIHVIAQGQKS